VNLRSRIKPWMPPALLEVRQRRLGHVLRFTDGLADWTEALRQSSGYSVDSIIERVAAATRAVVAGRARYERDSVLFHESDYRYPIVTQLLRAALVNRGRLNVIDFGGSFGSTYRQCRPLLDGVDEVRWQVIEQPAFVSIGQREFTTEELSFVPTIQELTPSEVPALILLSSVLQYLEHPEPTLTQLLRLDATHLVVDRTPFSTQPDDRLCVQHTPSSIYDASYPCWILSAPRLRGLVLSEGWQIEAEFDSGDGHFRTARGLEFVFRGFIAERPPANAFRRPPGSRDP